MQLPDSGLRPFESLYLHIPFCRHKCGYCDFNAYAGMDRLMPAYVDALMKELARARERFTFLPLQTLYLGGGTPSLLPPELMTTLLAGVRDLFDIGSGAEVTLEANPASTDPHRLQAWREAGVNRLSLGVQGFEPRALAVLERRTDAAQAVRAYSEARAAGFDNISIDLIYAVPFQSLQAWQAVLEAAVALAPDHISAYCLTVEDGTLLARRVKEGKLPLVEADTQWEQMDLATSRLAAAGYTRYEVSSWARSGRESRHNQAYWRCAPVYGAGAGAHSYAADGERAWRWWNVANPRAYVEASPAVLAEGEELDPPKARAEALMMGLRTIRGVVPPSGFDGPLEQLKGAGLVVSDGSRVMPTRRGLDLHNQVALAVL